jgi:RNA polymerase sigma factor (sigma-70 family)
VSGKGEPKQGKSSRGLAGVVLRCQPDSRLAALVRGGYGEGFEEIARRYGPALISFAGSIVPSHRAEDVVQEALLKAYRSLPESDPGLKLRPWLYTIVRNTALNDLRDERMHERVDEDWDGVPQPPELMARRAELALLFERIKGLPTQQREALVKRELEGRSHEEIATALGATPGAVRALIFRARSALRHAAGLLLPIPLLRTLMDAGPVETASGGAGLGGAAAGLTAGGGMATKVGGALVVGAIAIGSGIAIHERAQKHDPDRGPIAEAKTPAHGGGARNAPPARARGELSSPRGRASGRGSGGESGSRAGSSDGDRGGSVPESGSSGPGGGGSSGSDEGAGAESGVGRRGDRSGTTIDDRSSSGSGGSGSSGGSGTSSGSSGSDDAVVDGGEGGTATSGVASSSGSDDGSSTLGAGPVSGDGASTTSSDTPATLQTDG